MRSLPRSLSLILIGSLGLFLISSTLGGEQDETDPPSAALAPTPGPPEFQAGLCWVGGGHLASMQAARERGANWISATPFAYGQRSFDQPPEPGFRFSRFRGESIEGIRDVVRAAHQSEMKVLVKPHVWFSRNGKWRGDIAMTSDEDWTRWFAAYAAFLDPFVELAAKEGAAAFCIGTELAGTIEREQEWRGLIASIRERYSGSLGFAANWYDEYQRVPFWDALDWIGVQAYFPLTKEEAPSQAALVEGWKPWIEQLRAASSTHQRPILFTEFGYKPRHATAIAPWEWSSDTPHDPEAQATAYRAAFEALAGEPWLIGLHLWKWYGGIEPGQRPRRNAHDNFSPQGLVGEETFFEGVRRLRADDAAER